MSEKLYTVIEIDEERGLSINHHSKEYLLKLLDVMGDDLPFFIYSLDTDGTNIDEWIASKDNEYSRIWMIIKGGKVVTPKIKNDIE